MEGGIPQPSYDNEEIDAAASLMSVYLSCVDRYGWSLKDIDETDIETLFEFLVFRGRPDPNIRVINGKIYRKATRPPSWL